MSNKKFDNVDMVNFISDAFCEGYTYCVEIATFLANNLNKEYLAKHKKVVNKLVEDLKATLVTISKEDLKKIAEEYLKTKSIREEIMGKKDEESSVIMASNAQVKKFGR